jgi:glutathione peroxidase
MKKLFLFCLIPMLTFQPAGIYNLTADKLGGGAINFSQYQGKRILLVNIATHSNHAAQLAQLEQLYQQHSNDLVVVAFPTNNFSNEPHSGSALQLELQNITYPIAAPVNVVDSPYTRHPVYQWLASKTENGVMNAKVRGDFYKFLLNKQGKIVAFFDSTTSPLSTVVQNALQIHQ